MCNDACPCAMSEALANNTYPGEDLVLNEDGATNILTCNPCLSEDEPFNLYYAQLIEDGTIEEGDCSSDIYIDYYFGG